MSLGVPQFPAPGSAQVAGGRSKVALKPGRSLMDWIRLANSGKDMTGTGGRVLKVTPEELAKHNQPGDCWMALRGKVYNVSAYMDFHPGGEDELMRGAGIDGTQLFDEVHRWVNAESMLAKCFVGLLEGDASPKKSNVPAKGRNSLTVNGLNSLLPPPGPAVPARDPAAGSSMPPPPVQVSLTRPPSGPAKPRYDWFQSATTVTLVIYTKSKKLRSEDVLLEKKGTRFKVRLLVGNLTFLVHLELEEDVRSDYNVKVHSSGKCEVTLTKVTEGQQWSKLGSPLEEDQTFVKLGERAPSFHDCTLLAMEEVTYDCRLMTFGFPEGVRMCVPLGFHVMAQAEIMGMEIGRFYTVVPPSLLHDCDEKTKAGRQLHLMIKIYQDGALTPHIGNLNIGDTLAISDYEGTFSESQLQETTHLVMVAAGTGFTPMAGLIKAALHIHHKPGRHVQLMFFNKEEKDILWRDQLDQLVKEHGLEVVYVLSKPHSEWEGPKGRVRRELLEGFIPVPREERNILFCACGPTAFTEESIRLVKDLGYTDGMIHAFTG